MIKNIINPYADVSFADTPRVPAITHQHIYNDYMFKGAYDRGIRVFACVNYFPSAPSVAPSGKLGLTSSQNFSSWRIPVEDWIDPKDIPSEVKDNAFNMSLEQLSQYKTTRYYEGSYPTITDKDGNVVNTANISQISNMEFAFLPWKRGVLNDRMSQHCNILGNLFAIPTNGMGDHAIYEGMTWDEEKAWRAAHPLYSFEELVERVTNAQYQQFEGKVFGTANHNYDVDGIKKYFDKYPQIFKAMECFNQCYSRNRNNAFRNAFDTLLSDGYRIWGTAATDWAGTREVDLMPSEEADWIAAYNALTPEQQAEYGSWKNYYNATATKECGDKDRGCNVLYIPNYDNLIAQCAQVAAEAALDAYIAGRYYMSGLNTHTISGVSVNNTATFTVSSNASTIRAKTKFKTQEISNTNSISIPINDKDVYVRFEAYFEDKDFIFTNPVFIEGDDKAAMYRKMLVLGII